MSSTKPKAAPKTITALHRAWVTGGPAARKVIRDALDQTRRITEAANEQRRLAKARLQVDKDRPEQSPEDERRQAERHAQATAAALGFLTTADALVTPEQLFAAVPRTARQGHLVDVTGEILDPLVASGQVGAAAIAAGGGIRYWIIEKP